LYEIYKRREEEQEKVRAANAAAAETQAQPAIMTA
jgi:hypothetical protein